METERTSGAVLEMPKEQTTSLEIRETALSSELSSELPESRTLVKTQIAEHRDINSSAAVASLPDEVLAMIFEAGASRQAEDFEDNRFYFSLLVSQITHRFRTIAIATPSLWTYIDIHLAEHTSLLDLQLQRSKSCTLDICIHDIYLPRNTTFKEEAHIQLFMNKIILHAANLRRLAIRAFRPSFVKDVVSHLYNISVPNLEDFCVILDEESYTPQEWLGSDNKCIFDGGAPNLSSVSLSGISIYCCQTPWAAVTTLSLDADSETYMPITYVRFAETLRALSSLRQLSLIGLVFAFGAEDVVAVEIPPLRSLVVRPWNYRDAGVDDNGGSYTFKLFASIIAPGLSCLTFSTSTPEQNDAFLESLRLHSSPKYPILRSLVVDPREGAPLPHITFFNAFPSLLHFELSGIFYAEALMDLFIYWDNKSSMLDAPSICPKLRSIALPVSITVDGAYLLTKLESFLASCVAVKRPLHKVCLITDGSPHDLELFRDLQAYDIEVELKRW